MSIVEVIVILIVIGVLVYLLNTLLPVDHRFKTIINAVIIIATILWLADVFFGYSPRYDSRGCNRPVRTGSHD
jgi:preprotein translocase subunit SecE